MTGGSNDNYKAYRAIFFDWDGTAVPNRSAPIDDVLPLMIALLERGVILVIISGTTYEKIAFGDLHSQIPSSLRKNLYLGLGRGAYNFGFPNGKLELLHHRVPKRGVLATLHRVAFDVHLRLLERYGIETDIVFSRPNYCKIDLLVRATRENRNHIEYSEVEAARETLSTHGYTGGIAGLIEEASTVGNERGLPLRATCDGKFLEVGLTTKADNVEYIFSLLADERKICASECAFWGDEFGSLDRGVPGSDAEMITPLTEHADFYDVSGSPMELPECVHEVPGGVTAFLEFLRQQQSVRVAR
jgi:hypothetical protein